ncbi:MAG TPA: hypothetical protein VJB13_03430 [Candidatus Nanoarchaeia archaeon]|nr:hypothetical protein [Candidatus Nanoarchaeia archaeon]
MKSKTVGKLLFQSFLLLVLLFGLVRLIVMKSGKFAMLELAGLIGLLLISVVGLATYNKSGDRALFFVFLLYTVNILAIWVHYHSLYLILLLGAALGLLTSIPHRSQKSCEVKCGEKCGEECGTCCGTCQCGPEPMTSAPPQKVSAKVEPKAAAEVEAKEAAVPAKAKFTPGKYVASKRSNVYHEPKCDWAKKIQKDRRVWFASREEALNKGYKKHECVN